MNALIAPHIAAVGAFVAVVALWAGAPGCDVEAVQLPAREDADAIAVAEVSADGSGTDSAASPPEAQEGPPVAGERALTHGSDGDDLFPSLDGDELVWVRIRVDATLLASGQEAPDCLSCPYCTGCVADIRHRRLPDGEEETLSTTYGVRAAPRIGDGHIVWFDQNGYIQLYDLATRRTASVPETTYGNRTPIPFGGALWWYGYDYSSWGSWGLMAYDLSAGERSTELVTPMDDGWWGSGGLNGMGVGQPFALGTKRVVWSRWEAADAQAEEWTFVVHAWPYYGTEAPAVPLDPERDHIHPMLTASDTLVTENYLHGAGCTVGNCDLALTAYPANGAPRELAPGAKPSLLIDPVVAGDRIVWLDHRDGLYHLWAVDVARPAEGARRMTSDKAKVGTLSTFAAGTRGLVWADRRTGRWRLYSRDW